jgi:L-ribulose-5-phosphate 3-epimerase
MHQSNRREFIQTTSTALLGLSIASGAYAAKQSEPRSAFKIGLATNSFKIPFRKREITIYDLFRIAREEYDIGLVDFKTTMLGVPDLSMVNRLNKEAQKYKVEIPYILVAGDGYFGGREEKTRRQAFEYHSKWFPIARDLGCKYIRVDWRGTGTKASTARDPERLRQVIKRTAPGMRELAEMGEKYGVGIALENHMGLSGFPKILLSLVKAIGADNLRTFLDFGNFEKGINRYEGTDMMMPTTEMVCAKCHDFDDKGNETRTDYERMFQIIFDKHHFKGNIHIEYEGKKTPPKEGVHMCVQLLNRLRKQG